MAIALTRFESYGVQIDQPVTRLFKQYAVFEITGAAADVDYDFGDYSGTFWTAVGATSPGTTALKAIKDIALRAKAYLQMSGKGLTGKALGAAVAAGVYTVNLDGTNTTLPNLLFNAGEGPTSQILVLEWELTPQQDPVKVIAP